jgi:hypothetical protein
MKIGELFASEAFDSLGNEFFVFEAIGVLSAVIGIEEPLTEVLQ